MNGIATAIDALWAIKDMVLSEQAVFTLPELAQCLICDWGHDMKEPFCSSTMGDDRVAVLAERFKKLRGYALGRPKFGRGDAEVDRFARRLMHDLIELAYEAYLQARGPVADRLAALRARYGTSDRPFRIIVTPGITTFEDYGGIGSFLGASADGRGAGQPVASDCSPYRACDVRLQEDVSRKTLLRHQHARAGGGEAGGVSHLSARCRPPRGRRRSPAVTPMGARSGGD